MAKTLLDLREELTEQRFESELQRGYAIDLRHQFNAAVACLLRETGKSIEEISTMIAAQTAIERTKPCVSDPASPSSSSPSSASA